MNKLDIALEDAVGLARMIQQLPVKERRPALDHVRELRPDMWCYEMAAHNQGVIMKVLSSEPRGLFDLGLRDEPEPGKTGRRI